jgi:hypothetical protein
MTTNGNPTPPLTALFTPGEIESLIQTAAETVWGNAVADGTLSNLQVNLTQRAWAWLTAAEPAGPGQQAITLARSPAPADEPGHRPSVLDSCCQICGAECVTITWHEDTSYQATVHSADIAAAYEAHGMEPPARIRSGQADGPMGELLSLRADEDHCTGVEARVVTHIQLHPARRRPA